MKLVYKVAAAALALLLVAPAIFAAGVRVKPGSPETRKQVTGPARRTSLKEQIEKDDQKVGKNVDSGGGGGSGGAMNQPGGPNPDQSQFQGQAQGPLWVAGKFFKNPKDPSSAKIDQFPAVLTPSSQFIQVTEVPLNTVKKGDEVLIFGQEVAMNNTPNGPVGIMNATNFVMGDGKDLIDMTVTNEANALERTDAARKGARFRLVRGWYSVTVQSLEPLMVKRAGNAMDWRLQTAGRPTVISFTASRLEDMPPRSDVFAFYHEETPTPADDETAGQKNTTGRYVRQKPPSTTYALDKVYYSSSTAQIRFIQNPPQPVLPPPKSAAQQNQQRGR